MEQQDGMVGLGRMGGNMARRIARSALASSPGTVPQARVRDSPAKSG